MTSTRLSLVTTGIMLLTIAVAPARAQPQGRITGTVRDTTGIAVPGVTITATNRASNVPQTTVTSGDGTFSLSVAPGTYNVVAVLVGFRRVAQMVDIAGGATRDLQISLEPALSEEVTVTATKREEILLDVPLSMVAPTEETLRARGVENLEGVAANVGSF